MGVSRLAHQNEIGKHQTQEVLKQPERRENQEGNHQNEYRALRSRTAESRF